MLKLITQKYDTSFSASQKAASGSPAFKQDTYDEDKSFTQTIKDNKMNILAGGLLTGGGVLLYLGLTKPGKNTLFNRFVEGKISDMENIVRKYTDYATDNIVNSFKGTVEYISAYRKTHIFKPSEFLTQINMFKEPIKIADSQDIAFSAIHAKKKELSFSAACDIDEFASKFNKIKYRVTGEIERQKHRTKMELDDYRHLPDNKSQFGEERVEMAETRLNMVQQNLIEYMNRVQTTKMNIALKSQFRQMADAIVESIVSQNVSKETILDTTFGKVKRILRLDGDFVPEYGLQRYDLQLKDISQHLKPQNLPEDIVKNVEPNIFLKVAQEEDLRKHTDKDLKKIFFKISSDYNLKDLRYLIDRVRLRQAASGGDKKGKAAYDSLILKLKYLSNKLNDFGENQVVEYSKFDFAKMSEEQRRAKLYYLSTAGRRLGYENFAMLNKSMLKTNEAYRRLPLKDYSNLISSNPDLYFVG